MLTTAAPTTLPRPRHRSRRRLSMARGVWWDRVTMAAVIIVVGLACIVCLPVLVVAMVCDWFGWMEEP